MFKANENVILKANENIYCLLSFSAYAVQYQCLLLVRCGPIPERATDGAEICLPMVSAAQPLLHRQKECCLTLPNESTTATTAAALNRGMKRAVNVRRLAFTTGVSTWARTRASKSAPRSDFLLKLLIYKQIFIAEQMSGYFLLCEEVAQHRFLLHGSFALPISL